MTNRDWDAELRKIDEQMSKAANQPVAAPVARPVGSAAPAAAVPAAAATTTALGVYTRLGLAVAVGVGIIFWPYGARCGLGMLGYLAAVATVIVSGGWSAIWSWRHRAARAHLLSLLLILWGLVLAGVDILPRVGYAIPTAAHPTGWSCG